MTNILGFLLVATALELINVSQQKSQEANNAGERNILESYNEVDRKVGWTR